MMENVQTRLQRLAASLPEGSDDALGALRKALEENGAELRNALKTQNEGDAELLWERLLRSCHMCDLKNELGLNYLLPQDRVPDKTPAHGKLALVMHIYYADLAAYCYRYALSMPEDCDVYITTGSEQKKAEIEEVFRRGSWPRLEVTVIENRGRDVSALLVAAAPKIEEYSYVCFAHDKRAPQIDWGIVGAAFSEHCFSNLLPTRAFVENVLALFEREKHLGLLTPPPPIHASYYPTLGVEWGPNYEETKKLHALLGLNCPISPDKEPVAPLGTMFWFRPAALKKLLDYGWQYDDFPPEPNGSDGTMLHAIERLYPYVAQDAGYYAAWLLSEENARAELSELSYLLGEIGRSAQGAYGKADFSELIGRMDDCWSHPNRRDNPTRLWPYLGGVLKRHFPK